MTSTHPNWRLIYAAIAAALLAAPLIAMQLTNEVKWSGGDFITFAVMLAALGLTIEMIIRTAKHPKARLIAVGLAVIAFLWLWAELAVGIFTNWGS